MERWPGRETVSSRCLCRLSVIYHPAAAVAQGEERGCQWPAPPGWSGYGQGPAVGLRHHVWKRTGNGMDEQTCRQLASWMVHPPLGHLICPPAPQQSMFLGVDPQLHGNPRKSLCSYDWSNPHILPKLESFGQWGGCYWSLEQDADVCRISLGKPDAVTLPPWSQGTASQVVNRCKPS